MNNIRAVVEQTGSALKAIGQWVVRGYSEGDRRAQELFPRVQANEAEAPANPQAPGLAGRIQASLNQMSPGLQNLASRVAGVTFGASNVVLRLVEVAFLVAGLMTVAPLALRMALAGILISLLSHAQAAAQQSAHRRVISDMLGFVQRAASAVQGLFEAAPAAAPSAAPSAAPTASTVDVD